MTAEPETKIIVNRGIPPSGDIVFTTTDREGNSGDLFELVVNETGHGSPQFSPEELSDGFAVVRSEGLPTLVFVVTVEEPSQGVDVTERLLREHLSRALLAIAPEVSWRSLWLPLMGTGVGGLDAEQSFIATLETLKSSAVVEKGKPARVVISGSPNLDPRILNSMQRSAVKVFGDRLVVTGSVDSSETTDQAPSQDVVEEVQRRLRDFGYAPGPADGVLGSETAEAIRRFQLKKGLAMTGVVDNNLLKLLREPDKELRPEMESEPERESARQEHTPFHPDHPASFDTLGREVIAEAISTIALDARRQSEPVAGREDDQTFVVHIHGRWGSGKTSILNFLRQILKSGRNSEPWVVVEYNAWRSQGHGPAWWTLLNCVHGAAVEQLGGWSTEDGRKMIGSDFLWRMRCGWIPYAVLVVMVLVLVLIWSVVGSIDTKDALAIVGSIVAVAGGLFAFGRTYRIGSARTATTFLELTRDPLGPLTHRYETLIAEIQRPVAVLVDDLDRCDAAFVVELLHSIQTLYRRARVLYVVAADRDWVRCSYEQIYDSFRGSISEPGRPLGFLFLEKIFQLSITVPNLSTDVRRDYWKQLVAGQERTSQKENERIRKEEQSAIEKFDKEADILAYTETIRDDPVRRRIAGAQAFRRMQTAPLRAEREHFLMDYADLVEPNPRAMKRLVNAYGFKRGYELMAGVSNPRDALVRWTVLELRWPELAAHLARHPDDLSILTNKTTRGSDIEALLADREVKWVTEKLTPILIRRVAGSTAVELANEPAAA